MAAVPSVGCVAVELVDAAADPVAVVAGAANRVSTPRTVDLGVGSLSIATDTRSLIMTGNVGDTAITGSLGTTTVTDNCGTLAGWTAT